MSFIGDFGHKHTALRKSHNERYAGYHKTISEHSRLVQIQNMIQQTNREIERLKNRLNQLESTAGSLPSKQEQRGPENGAPAVQTPPLPIAELKQLAEMAKRFK
jgi:chromosome segregation ATPase